MPAMEGMTKGMFLEDVDRQIRSTRKIRKVTKTSTKHRRQLSSAIEPLVSMLCCGEPEGTEHAILTLLNLTIKDERFTRKLVEVYGEFTSKGEQFEVVFVSGDEDAESFDEYFAKMPWLVVPFANAKTGDSLSDLFEGR